MQVNQSSQLKTYVRRPAGQSQSQDGLNSLDPRLRFQYKVQIVTNTISRWKIQTPKNAACLRYKHSIPTEYCRFSLKNIFQFLRNKTYIIEQ